MGKMNKLKFSSQICTTKEQSQRLLDLGLKPETADMGWVKLLNGDGYVIAIAEDYSFIDIPAWSLHRLIEMMPKQVKTPKPTYGWVGEDLTFRMDDDLYIQYGDWGIENEEYRFCGKGFYNSNLYDNIIECIEWLIKEDYFNKEYLKQ